MYVCRHLGDSGMVAMFTSMKTVLRPWALHTFTDYGLAKKQFKEYTFPKRMGKGKLFSSLVSPVASFVLVSLAKSAKSIPVYRGKEGMRSITTLKNSVKALEEGDHLLICPDVDYADDSEKETGEIYKGFFAVDKLYYKKTGKRVQFVPVYIDKNRIVLHSSVEFGNKPDEETIATIVQGMYNA